MPLRDYQKQALEQIKYLFNQGCRRQILSMPTGLGKTVIFTQVHQALDLKRKFSSSRIATNWSSRQQHTIEPLAINLLLIERISGTKTSAQTERSG